MPEVILLVWLVTIAVPQGFFLSQQVLLLLGSKA
jgi:hypothetical protein